MYQLNYRVEVLIDVLRVMIREHGKAETTFDALGKLCNFSSDTARRAVQDAVKYNVITVKKGEKLGVYIFTLNK